MKELILCKMQQIFTMGFQHMQDAWQPVVPERIDVILRLPYCSVKAVGIMHGL